MIKLKGRTLPKFALTGKEVITFYRSVGDGEYINGEWKEPEFVEIPLVVNIQPLRTNEILQLPEAERTREWLKVYCAEDIRKDEEGFGGHRADEFEWQGNRYKVMSLRKYSMGVLDHTRAFAARIGKTPDG